MTDSALQAIIKKQIENSTGYVEFCQKLAHLLLTETESFSDCQQTFPRQIDGVLRP